MPVASLDSPLAPTARVEPSADSAMLKPNWAPARVLDALMYACWLHIAPLRVNTQTAPAESAESLVWSPSMPVASLDSPLAPTARVEPSADSATLKPNWAPARVLDALMYTCWLHIAPLRVNT